MRSTHPVLAEYKAERGRRLVLNLKTDFSKADLMLTIQIIWVEYEGGEISMRKCHV